MNFYANECGRCGTELVPFRAVYEAGTFTGNVSGSVSGTIWASDGLHSYNHRYDNPVIMQNDAARRCAPPEAPYLSGWIAAAALSLIYAAGQLFVIPVIVQIGKTILPIYLFPWKLLSVGFLLLWIVAAIFAARFFNLRFLQGFLALCCIPAVLVMGVVKLAQYLSVKPCYAERLALWKQSYLCPRCGGEYLIGTVEPD